jgi:MoaA/NifB/PqqE/SkfB family radical SAM enzyme
MCELWKHDFRIDIPKFVANLDKLSANNFRILQLTGGEPTLLQELPDIVRAAREKGFLIQVMTNGTTMTDELAERLAEAGTNIVCVSVDHYDDAIASEYRKFPNIGARIKETVRLLKKHGISVCSTTLLTRHNYRDIEDVIRFVNNELGMPFSFCNPENTGNYFLTADEKKASNLTKDELIHTIERILEMKENGASILSTKAHIKNTLAFLKSGKSKYLCKAGKNVVFIDWDMNVFPCFKKPKMCGLSELASDKLHDLHCDECTTQCFREPSIFYYRLGKLEYMSDVNVLFGALKGAVLAKPRPAASTLYSEQNK